VSSILKNITIIQKLLNYCYFFFSKKFPNKTLFFFLFFICVGLDISNSQTETPGVLVRYPIITCHSVQSSTLLTAILRHFPMHFFRIVYSLHSFTHTASTTLLPCNCFTYILIFFFFLETDRFMLC